MQIIIVSGCNKDYIFLSYLIIAPEELVSYKPATSSPILVALCLRLVKFCQQPSQALRINSLSQGPSWSDQVLYKNERLNGTSRKKYIPPHYLRAIPTKMLPVLTSPKTSELTPCHVHCPMHSSLVGLISHMHVVLLPVVTSGRMRTTCTSADWPAQEQRNDKINIDF